MTIYRFFSSFIAWSTLINARFRSNPFCRFYLSLSRSLFFFSHQFRSRRIHRSVSKQGNRFVRSPRERMDYSGNSCQRQVSDVARFCALVCQCPPLFTRLFSLRREDATFIITTPIINHIPRLLLISRCFLFMLFIHM